MFSWLSVLKVRDDSKLELHPPLDPHEPRKQEYCHLAPNCLPAPQGLWQQKWVLFQAFHLIKAVSVLLNFSQEEENMLKETLEYKVSFPDVLFPLLDEGDQAVERTFFILMFFPLSPPDFVHHSISLMALSQLLQL